MKVVHISTHDSAGGAARAAARLHQGLLRRQIDSSMLVAVQHGGVESVSTVVQGSSPARRLSRWMTRRRIEADHGRYSGTRPAGLERFSDDRTWLGESLAEKTKGAQIVHLHWVADLLDYSFFRKIDPKVKVVWTLHDMNPFTGGCHYSGGCDGFTTRCGACPQLGSTDPNDLSREIWTRKQRALRAVGDAQLQVVGDSYWMEAEARRSSLLGRFPATTIHYGLDTDVFAPVDRETARAEIGIPGDAKALLFVADSIDNRRKGFGYLLRAVERLKEVENLTLVSVGSAAPEVPGWAKQLHLGSIRDDATLARVYSAADLFVIPSVEEAYGQTALEAMACGTPSVGFGAGGIPDVIRAGRTGLIVPTGDSSALADAIATVLLDDDLRVRMSAECRRIALAEHTLERQADDYISIYRGLLGADDR